MFKNMFKKKLKPKYKISDVCVWYDEKNEEYKLVKIIENIIENNIIKYSVIDILKKNNIIMWIDEQELYSNKKFNNQRKIKMKKNYLLVNVFGDNGYSFVVYGEYTSNEESDVIDACLKNDLFQDFEDANCCSVVDADDYDVQYFNTINAIYEI